MKKQFISPNLRYKSGNIYYLNKYEIKLNNYNYVNENYYIDFKNINTKIDNIDIEVIVNDYSDEILIKFEIDDETNLKEIMKNINMKLCNLENFGEAYNINI